jgi:undecaprenyl diphosphate synthase
VDLFIRTGGEVRTSNFLPWQTTYAEMVFNEILWPDYTREAFREDLWIYAGRDRRFGMVST